MTTSAHTGGRAGKFMLQVRPHAAYVSTARLFAAAVARHFGWDEFAVDDLKLAVSEACTSSIRDRATDAPADAPIRVAAHWTDGRLWFEVADTSVAPPPDTGGRSREELSPDTFERTLGLEVIRGLFADADVAPAPEGGRVIRFSIPPETARE